jgi:hypothetical protein
MTTQTHESEVQRLTAESQAILEVAQDFKIVTVAHYEDAAADLRAIKAKAKELDDLRRSMTRPLDDAKKRIMSLFERPLSLLTQAESGIKRAILAYRNEQERIRALEEARLREVARKEQERLMARAAKATAMGKDEKAEALEEQAQNVLVPIVPLMEPKISGISTRQTWHAEIVDKAELIRAVAAGQVPDVVLVPDMPVLNAQARALKAALNYPGVKAVCEEIVAAGRDTDPVPPQPRN